MAPSPVKVLVLISIITVFNAMVIGSIADAPVFPEFEEPESEGFAGFIEATVGVIGAIWGVVNLVFDAVTFNIAGAPFWIRFPLASAMGLSLIWSIATLIRGN